MPRTIQHSLGYITLNSQVDKALSQSIDIEQKKPVNAVEGNDCKSPTILYKS